MKTLITDASYLQSLAIVRYLGKKNINNFVLGHNKKLDIARYSKYCKRYYNSPNPKNEKQYIKFILKILTQKNIDVFIPVSYIATAIAAKYKEEINQVSRVEIANHNKVKVALNKKSTYKLAEEVGVPYPKTFYPKNIKDVKKIREQINYPIVIKGMIESGSTEVSYVNNEKELFKKWDLMSKKNKINKKFPPMIQRYINTNFTYGFMALYQQGKCKNFFMHKEVRSVPIKGGSGTYLESYFDQKLKSYGLKLLNSLKWHGVALCEFKKDYNNNYSLMEINPKFWASTDIALKAGVNFPHLLCQMSQGKKIDYLEKYNRNLKFHFPFSRELKHIKQKPLSTFKIILDSLNPKIKSNVWLSDLKPNLIELYINIASIIIPKTIKLLIKNKIINKNAK